MYTATIRRFDGTTRTRDIADHVAARAEMQRVLSNYSTNVDIDIRCNGRRVFACIKGKITLDNDHWDRDYDPRVGTYDSGHPVVGRFDNGFGNKRIVDTRAVAIIK